MMNRKPKGARVVDVGITAPWSWVSYVGAVNSVLKSRGVECDLASVAGLSGYAFVVNIGRHLGSDAITAFDWKMLEEGTSMLGVAVEIVSVDCDDVADERARLHLELFERVRAEIDLASPCVVWGAATVPEFVVVYGYDGETYLVRSVLSATGARGVEPAGALGPFERPEKPVRSDSLGASGRLGAVFFGEAVSVDRLRAEQKAVVRAGQLLAGRHICFEPDYVQGWQAFEYWAERLADGKFDPSGNSYTLNCLCELQLLASSFCRRLGGSLRKASKPLEAAAAGLGRSADRLNALRETFPFPGSDDHLGPASLQGAVRSLRACAVDNRQSLGALQDAAALL
jgi:hypothetical protein